MRAQEPHRLHLKALSTGEGAGDDPKQPRESMQSTIDFPDVDAIENFLRLSGTFTHFSHQLAGLTFACERPS